MHDSYMDQLWICPECGEIVTKLQAVEAVPVHFRHSSVPWVRILQQLADYRIEIVNMGHRKLKVEYPRESV